MNGTVILNNITQQLADEIFTYREKAASASKNFILAGNERAAKSHSSRERERAQRAAARYC